MTVAEKRAAFRALHDNGFFVIPNAWDIGSTVRLVKLGFKAVASTSAGAAWAIGKEDGQLTIDEALANIRLLVDASDLPVNADFENGFADDPDGVAANVARAVDTGIAGLSIEDWSESGFYDIGLATERVAAARAAMDASVMLVGRTEHYHQPTRPVAESVARIIAYAEAGADILFAPGVTDHGAIAEIVTAVAPKPVNVVVHAYDEISALKALGVRRVSVGGSLAKAAWDGFDAASKTLKDNAPELRQD